ncbi:MAG: WXG100 family type VII secretion target [Actinomadura sp.]
MSNDYTPAVAKTISVAHKVGGEAGAMVEYFIDLLWGDPKAIKRTSDVWINVANDARSHIVDTILNEAKAVGRDHWSGSAKDEYTAWMENLHSGLKRIQDASWQVGSKLLHVRDQVETMRDDLEKMGQWFLGEIAAAAIKGKSPHGAALLAIASAWKLVEKLQDYYYNATDKFRTAVTDLQLLRRQGEALMTPTSTNLPGPLPLPAETASFGPAFPTRQVGDWRNWGDAAPGARQ